MPTAAGASRGSNCSTLNADGGAEKIYAWADGERSLAADFSGIRSMEKIRQQLTQRGYRATTSYADFHAWLTKETGIPRAKAMGYVQPDRGG